MAVRLRRPAVQAWAAMAEPVAPQDGRVGCAARRHWTRGRGAEPKLAAPSTRARGAGSRPVAELVSPRTAKAAQPAVWTELEERLACAAVRRRAKAMVVAPKSTEMKARRVSAAPPRAWVEQAQRVRQVLQLSQPEEWSGRRGEDQLASRPERKLEERPALRVHANPKTKAQAR